MKQNELPPQAQLMNFIVEKWISKPIYAAAELEIADMLATGPKSIEELAKESLSFNQNVNKTSGVLWCNPSVPTGSYC